MNVTIRALAALALSAIVAIPTASAEPSAVPTSGVDERALRSLAAEGTRLWECSSSFSRLGKARPVSSVDPGIALRRLAADFSAAGRYEEFRYLIEYVEKQVAAKRLEVLVVEGSTPLPGFWPARRDGTRRAISIGADEYASLSPDSSLYRSSFLRAAAALFYTDAAPALQGTVSGRNAAAELSAVMSGLWVESLYLLEIVKLTGPEGVAPDYIDALLSSAAADNLRGAASLFFRVDLDFAYDAIRIARKGATRSGTVDFLDGAARFSSDLAARVASSVVRPSPRPSDLELGASARAALISLPSVVRSVLRGPFAKDAETLEAAARLVLSLSDVSRAYSALDPLVMAEGRKRLNELRFSRPDPSFPLVRRAADYYDLPAASVPPSLPGAASEAWFRLCLPSRPYEYSGELPLGREAALRGSSFRFSYDEGGAFLSVEHFADGRLRASEELHWAARVRAGRDESSAWWVWENAYGFPAYNELGFAVMRRRATVDGEVLRFYSPDGRGVPDRAGAWSVGIGRVDGGYDVSYRDSAGALYSGPSGYAVDSRRTGPGGEETRTLYDEKGGPATSLARGFHGSVSARRLGEGAVSLGETYFDVNGAAFAILNGQYGERVRVEADLTVFELLDAEGEAAVGTSGWAVERISGRDGLVENLRFFSADGQPAVSAEGFHEARYELGPYGDVASVRFFDASGAPVSCRDGYHERRGEYDDRGGLEELRFYGPGGEAAADSSGAARIRWSIGADGSIDGVTVWDSSGSLMVGEPSRAL